MRGYHFGGSASRSSYSADLGIGSALKDAMSEPGAWQIGLYAFGECLPYADNRVSLNTNKKDKWGRPLVAINCVFKENEFMMNKEMGDVAAEMLTASGFKDVNIRNEISSPGNANHEMGTARMGHDPKTSVLNLYNQMHEVPNVFITDGSCMSSSSCVNPSLTYMALTARACNYAFKEMKKLTL